MGQKDGGGHAGAVRSCEHLGAVAEAVVQLVVVVYEPEGGVRLHHQIGLVAVALAQDEVVQGR